ncbi:MAG: acyltransferase [Saprospiraceae bacterium]|nr:acyltransferase [Saprospiraceae bacterium]
MMTNYLSQKIRVVSLLCMVMVVMVHAYNLPERYLHAMSMVQAPMTLNNFLQLFLGNGFSRFAIPLFFMISGYLNFPKPDVPYRDVAWKRFRTVFVPYLLWSGFGLLLYAGVQENDFFWRATEKAALGAYSDIPVKAYSWGQWLYRWILEPIPFQLWFLRCLFTYTLLTPLLLRGLRRAPGILLSFFGMLWFIDFNLLIVEGMGLLFYSMGLLLRDRNIDLQQPPRWFNWPLAASLWMALLLLKTWLAFGDYTGPSTTAQLFLFRGCQALGVPVIWFGVDRLLRGRTPAPVWIALSSYTFILYGMHAPLLHVISEGMFLTYGESDTTRWWVYLVTVTAVTGVCLGFGWLLKRFTPGVFSWLTGGRGVS